MDELRIQRLHIDEQLRSMGHASGPYAPPGRERRERGYGSDHSEEYGGYRGRGRGASGRGMPGRGRGGRGRYFAGKEDPWLFYSFGGGERDGHLLLK